MKGATQKENNRVLDGEELFESYIPSVIEELHKGKNWEPVNNILNNISYKIVSENCRVFIEAIDNNEDLYNDFSGKQMISTDNFIHIIGTENTYEKNLDTVFLMRKLYEDEKEVLTERELHEHYIPLIKKKNDDVDNDVLNAVIQTIISDCKKYQNFNIIFDVEKLIKEEAFMQEEEYKETVRDENIHALKMLDDTDYSEDIRIAKIEEEERLEYENLVSIIKDEVRKELRLKNDTVFIKELREEIRSEIRKEVETKIFFKQKKNQLDNFINGLTEKEEPEVKSLKSILISIFFKKNLVNRLTLR